MRPARLSSVVAAARAVPSKKFHLVNEIEQCKQILHVINSDMLKGEYDAVNQAAIRNNCGLVPGQPVSGATLSASLGDTNVKPNLGLSGSTITGSSTAAISMNDPHGAFVSAVTRDGNAAKAGLVPGDIIEAFNGHRVVSIEDLNNFVSQSQSGSTVKLDVYRRGVVLAVEAKL